MQYNFQYFSSEFVLYRYLRMLFYTLSKKKIQDLLFSLQKLILTVLETISFTRLFQFLNEMLSKLSFNSKIGCKGYGYV